MVDSSWTLFNLYFGCVPDMNYVILLQKKFRDFYGENYNKDCCEIQGPGEHLLSNLKYFKGYYAPCPTICYAPEPSKIYNEFMIKNKKMPELYREFIVTNKLTSWLETYDFLDSNPDLAKTIKFNL